jgi:hypothetical protein
MALPTVDSNVFIPNDSRFYPNPNRHGFIPWEGSASALPIQKTLEVA